MRAVFVMDKSQKERIERELKSDDLLSRGSILFKDGSGFGMEGKYILVYDGSEEMVEKVGEIEGLERVDNEEILRKIDEEESRAREGFGFILG